MSFQLLVVVQLPNSNHRSCSICCVRSKSGVNETARRLKQLVGQIFRFAIVTGRAKRDPSADLKDALQATREPQRHRAMPLLELPTFLRKLETYSGEQQTKLALKLVAHSGGTHENAT